MYDSLNEVVYPRYSVIDPNVLTLSGFKEQSFQEYIGFGTFGAVLHGIIGIKTEVINAPADIIPEYINFFLNFIFLVCTQSL
jgi:hypothetical protein